MARPDGPGLRPTPACRLGSRLRNSCAATGHGRRQGALATAKSVRLSASRRFRQVPARRPLRPAWRGPLRLAHPPTPAPDRLGLRSPPQAAQHLRRCLRRCRAVVRSVGRSSNRRGIDCRNWYRLRPWLSVTRKAGKPSSDYDQRPRGRSTHTIGSRMTLSRSDTWRAAAVRPLVIRSSGSRFLQAGVLPPSSRSGLAENRRAVLRPLLS